MRFEMFRRFTLRGYRWYFRLRATNGQIVAQSEGYSRRTDALSTVESIRAGVKMAPVVYETFDSAESGG
ncbi:MAG: hypothetical protein DDT26_00020 [Dehalococcoidia bacterium]|nr:hypothetical protein [Chloroflexota bacterium]